SAFGRLLTDRAQETNRRPAPVVVLDVLGRGVLHYVDVPGVPLMSRVMDDEVVGVPADQKIPRLDVAPPSDHESLIAEGVAACMLTAAPVRPDGRIDRLHWSYLHTDHDTIEAVSRGDLLAQQVAVLSSLHHTLTTIRTMAALGFGT